MLVKSLCKRSIGAVDTIGCMGHFGQGALILKAMHAGLYGLLHLVGHSWLPEVLPQQAQGNGHALDDLHLSGTHSEW